MQPFSDLERKKEIESIVEKKVKPLTIGFRDYLYRHKHQTEFFPEDYYPELYGKIGKLYWECLKELDLNKTYSREIEEGNYTISEKNYYYFILYWNVVNNIIHPYLKKK